MHAAGHPNDLTICMMIWRTKQPHDGMSTHLLFHKRVRINIAFSKCVKNSLGGPLLCINLAECRRQWLGCTQTPATVIRRRTRRGLWRQLLTCCSDMSVAFAGIVTVMIPRRRRRWYPSTTSCQTCHHPYITKAVLQGTSPIYNLLPDMSVSLHKEGSVAGYKPHLQPAARHVIILT